MIRYPGSKAKLVDEILDYFPWSVTQKLYAAASPTEYREPFFGAGAVGMRILTEIDCDTPVWLNDADPGMVAMWETVRIDPDGLMQKVDEFAPVASTPKAAEYFYKFKEEDGRTDLPRCQVAFRKIALHQTSFSGLGAMAGGPIGGRFQDDAKYPVGCRYSAQNIKKDIRRHHRILAGLSKLRITCGDFEPVITDAPVNSFIYLDPPYYEKGPELYKHSMDDAAHVRLAGLLNTAQCRWLLSYDDHPRIRELYAGCEFHDLHVTYTTATAKTDKRPKNREVVILPAETAVAV